jgi:hypothetical protein
MSVLSNRALPSGFIEPCIPTAARVPPSGYLPARCRGASRSARRRPDQTVVSDVIGLSAIMSLIQPTCSVRRVADLQHPADVGQNEPEARRAVAGRRAYSFRGIVPTTSPVRGSIIRTSEAGPWVPGLRLYSLASCTARHSRLRSSRISLRVRSHSGLDFTSCPPHCTEKPPPAVHPCSAGVFLFCRPSGLQKSLAARPEPGLPAAL